MTHGTRTTLAFALLLAASRALAQSPSEGAAEASLAPDVAALPSFEVSAEVEKPIAATHDADPTAAGTEVEVRDRPVAMESVGEALLQVPSTRAMNAAATLGTVTTVRLRGAEARQTDVMLGTLPLSTTDRGAFDVSLVPLHLLERIRVFRGGAPVWLSSGAIGGVVQLEPRQAQGTAAELTLEAGSFGTRSGHGTASVSTPRLKWMGTVGLSHTDGDFPYVDDRGTHDTAADDVEQRRINNEATQATGLMHLTADVGGGEMEGVVLGVGRHAGVPGPGHSPAFRASRQDAQLFGALGYSRELEAGKDRTHRYAVSVGSGHHRLRFFDLADEIGQRTQATDDRFTHAVLRGAGTWAALSWLDVTGVGSYRVEHFDPEDAEARVAWASSTRHTMATAFETNVHAALGDVRFQLRPSVRVEWSRAGLNDAHLGGARGRDVDNLLATYRLGAAAEPWRGVAFSASVASGRRLPSMLELFGDRSILEPNPDLEPERSRSVDVGVSLRGTLDALTGSAELRAFWRHTQDLIRIRQTSQWMAVAENVEYGTVRGIEAGLRGRWTRHLHLAGSLTLQDTENQRGLELPLRAPVYAFVRPEVHFFPGGPVSRVRLFGDVTHVGRNFRADANLAVLRARTWVSAGAAVELWERHVELQLRVRNIADQRAVWAEGSTNADLLGQPLPGRSIFVSLTLREEKSS